MPEPTRHYLDEILAFHRERVEADSRKSSFQELLESALKSLSKEKFNFSKALEEKGEGNMGVIAEIKRRSPSKGDLRKELSSVELISLAKEFEQAGATGISVLTDEKYFGGSLDDLKSVGEATNLPILRKDFTLSGLDIIDALEAGASAVLLIMAAFGEEQEAELISLFETAYQLGLDAFCEVHTLKELERATRIYEKLDNTKTNSAKICILVNQRDLMTFKEHPTRAVELSEHFHILPKSSIKIAASCIASAKAVQEVAAAGYHGVLVGEYLMKSPDPATSLAELLS